MRVLDRLPSTPYVEAAVAVALGIAVGLLAPMVFVDRPFVMAALVAAVLVFLYFLVIPLYGGAFRLMLLTLPLQTTVLEVGGTIRIYYLFALLAAGVGIAEGRLGLPSPRRLTILALYAFVAYSIASTALTVKIQDIASLTETGFRGLPIRSVIQAGQLVLMLLIFLLVGNQLRRPGSLPGILRLVYWSVLLVTVYGWYDMVAAVTGIPFVSISNEAINPRGSAAELAQWAAGVFLPRPRSTFPEPDALATYLMVTVPLLIAGGTVDPRLRRAGARLVIGAALILFFLANSRAAMIGTGASLLGLLILMPRRLLRLRVIAAAAAVYVLVAAVAFPTAGLGLDWLLPARYYGERITSGLQAGLQGGRSVGKNRLFLIGLQIFADNLPLGVGIGNFPFHFYQRVGESPDPVSVLTTTNTYLRMLVEQGIVGTLAFVIFTISLCVMLVRRIWRGPPAFRALPVAALFSMMAMLVRLYGVDALYVDGTIWVIFGIAYGIGAMPLQTSNGEQRAPRGMEERRSLQS